MSLEELVPLGTMIKDRYELRGVVGSGGFSRVFEAYDHERDRAVAIKMLEMAGLDPSSSKQSVYMQRFEREAMLIARLRHPNVLRIYGYGTHGEQQIPYMVVELLRGRDMHAQLLQHGGMPATSLFPLLLPVIDAIGVAHEQGVVHKDLCPANLFYRHPDTPQGSLCVLDFGIAYWRSAAARLTAKNSFLGTPRYIAPEYALKQQVGPELDVYQLGLVLVELLCGAPMVRATRQLDALLSHTQRKLEAPARLRDGPLWPVLKRALAAEAADRYPNGHALAEALAGVPANAIPTLAADEPTALIDS